MAWSHFTGYLSTADLITEAQRNELYDVFEERAAAVAAFLSATYSASSAVRTCGLSTDLLERSAGSSPLRLEAAINAIAPSYGRGSILAASSFSSSTAHAFSAGQGAAGAIFYDAAVNIGLSPGDVAGIFASGLDDLRRWNLYRSALGLLNHPRLAVTGISYRKRGIEAYDDGDPDPAVADAAWAAVKAEFIADSETAGTDVARVYARNEFGEYEFFSTRQVLTVTIPALPAFSGHTGIYVAIQNDSGLGLTFTWQGTAAGVTAPVYPTLKYTLFAGSGATGAGTGDLRFDAYAGGSAADVVRPDPAPLTIEHGASTTTPIYGAPVWTAG